MVGAPLILEGFSWPRILCSTSPRKQLGRTWVRSAQKEDRKSRKGKDSGKSQFWGQFGGILEPFCSLCSLGSPKALYACWSKGGGEANEVLDTLPKLNLGPPHLRLARRAWAAFMLSRLLEFSCCVCPCRVTLSSQLLDGFVECLLPWLLLFLAMPPPSSLLSVWLLVCGPSCSRSDVSFDSKGYITP